MNPPTLFLFTSFFMNPISYESSQLVSLEYYDFKFITQNLD